MFADFILGAARVLDAGATLARGTAQIVGSEKDADDAAWQSDADALASDWQAVGQDMYAALGDYRAMHGE
jgi:hypothetical protein